MFCYQEKVNAGVPQVCTPEKWDELIDSPVVKNICARIAALDPQAQDYNDRKQALKKRLPIIIPHASSFKNGRRVSADGIPSGLAMLDVDHVENPCEWFDAIDKQLLSDNKIYLVAITASGKGLRLIGERLERESIEAAQLRMSNALGIKEYDAVTKDLARASYIVPRDYILWIYEAGLFSEEARPDLIGLVSFLPALPPHVEEKDTSYEDALSYRGIAYKDIMRRCCARRTKHGVFQFSELYAVYLRFQCRVAIACAAGFRTKRTGETTGDFFCDRTTEKEPDADGFARCYRYLRERS